MTIIASHPGKCPTYPFIFSYVQSTPCVYSLGTREPLQVHCAVRTALVLPNPCGFRGLRGIPWPHPSSLHLRCASTTLMHCSAHLNSIYFKLPSMSTVHLIQKHQRLSFLKDMRSPERGPRQGYLCVQKQRPNPTKEDPIHRPISPLMFLTPCWSPRPPHQLHNLLYNTSPQRYEPAASRKAGD